MLADMDFLVGKDILADGFVEIPLVDEDDIKKGERGEFLIHGHNFDAIITPDTVSFDYHKKIDQVEDESAQE